MSDFPEFSTDELVKWLQAKYRRHSEIEDGVAAERLKSLTVEVKDLKKAAHDYLHGSGGPRCQELSKRLRELIGDARGMSDGND